MASLASFRAEFSSACDRLFQDKLKCRSLAYARDDNLVEEEKWPRLREAIEPSCSVRSMHIEPKARLGDRGALRVVEAIRGNSLRRHGSTNRCRGPSLRPFDSAQGFGPEGPQAARSG